MTATSDARKIAVFNNGIWKGLNGIILQQGHRFLTTTIIAVDPTDCHFGSLYRWKPTFQETTTTVDAPQAFL